MGVIGLENDQELANVILSYCQNPYCISLTGYTNSIRELMIIFHLASLLITNDGGPGHFAVMTPVPTIIFYGPETPTLYGTLDEKTIIFYVPLSCSPCLTAYNHRNSPCNGDNLCLKYIHPDQVVTAALEILKGQRNAKSISTIPPSLLLTASMTPLVLFLTISGTQIIFLVLNPVTRSVCL